MKKEAVALLTIILLVGIMAIPGSAESESSPEYLDNKVEQSTLDQGLRSVDVDPDRSHCRAAREQSQQDREQERKTRKADRLRSGTVGVNNTSEIVEQPESSEQPEIVDDQPVLEEIDSWSQALVVQETLKTLSGLVDKSPELLGYEIDEQARTIVVVHQRGANLDGHITVFDELLNNVEENVYATNEALAESDISDLSPEETVLFEQDSRQQENLVLVDADITIELRRVCRRGVGDLDQVQSAVEAFEWADDSIPADFLMVVERDLVLGKVRVVLKDRDDQNRKAKRLLKSSYGRDVSVVFNPDHQIFAGVELVASRGSVWGGRFQGGRYSDKSPHLGGAQVGDWGFRRGACTTGFAIDINGGRSMLTAGHCQDVLPVGTFLHSGVWGRSKSYEAYGNLYRSWWQSDTIDVALIGHRNHSYRRSIYTDPGWPKTRTVTSVWEPWIGARVCVSGSFTGATCGGKVKTKHSACFRGGSGCQFSYMAKGSNGRSLSKQGDSGGPVYIPRSSSRAIALGIVSMGLGNETIFVGSRAIEEVTGGRIARTCCDKRARP